MSWIEVTTIGDLLDRNLDKPDKRALVLPDRTVTYAELSALTDRIAAGLIALGVGPEDKVGILLDNRVEYAAILFAVAKLGAIGVPVNARFKHRELGHVISHGDVSVLFTAASKGGADYPEMIREVTGGLGGATEVAPELRHVVDVDSSGAAGLLAWSEFERAGEEVDVERVRELQHRVRVRDIGLLMYTSGTTSKPKGCLLSHESLVRQAISVATKKFELTREDRFWDPLPMFHCGGIVPMMGCFSVGATFFHAGHFDADVALRTLAEERITIAYPAFEAIWQGILNHPDFDQADLSALRLIQNIATPEKLAQFQARMPWADQVSSYGSTESSTNLTLPDPGDDYDVRINTLGTVAEGMEAKVVDPETGEDLPPDQVGELCFRGYSRFDGYYKDPELTAEAIDADGWFHTGDLCSLDAHGRVRFSGRIKDMLKVGGENVSALEVEDYLAGHPAVLSVQVVAAPDARYDEVPVAYIELRDGAAASEAEIIEFCIGSIASYKVPRYVRFVSEWPMSGTKVQKFVLRDRIAKELQEAGISEAARVEQLSAATAAREAR